MKDGSTVMTNTAPNLK